MKDYGCHGGNANYAYEYIMDYGITDETCSIYRAKGYNNGEQCTDSIKCLNCMPG